MKAKKFKYKTRKVKWSDDTNEILIGKHLVGYIHIPICDSRNPNGENSIRFRIVNENKTDENPSRFSWITLKYKPTDLQDAKRFLDEKFELLITKYNFYINE